MPPGARVWIYQAERELTETEQQEIKKTLEEFVSTWNSHGNELYSSFDIRYNRFVLIATNEDVNAASGCSIDKSVNTIKALADRFKVDFFNRLVVCYLEEDEVKQLPLAEFKQQIKEGTISPETVFFNNSASTIAELENNWKISVSSSWLKSLLKI